MSVRNIAGLPVELDSERVSLVRDHLEEVLASATFVGSKRSQDFLRLIIEHALAGRLDSLRERMIGAEMFGRPIGYDTANDAVVRVKATEVRRKLAQYYRELPNAPPVRIEIPTGSYEPKFHWASFATSVSPDIQPDSGPERTAPVAEWGQETSLPPRADGPPGPEPEALRNSGRRALSRASRVLVALTAGLALVAILGYLGYRRRSGAGNGPPQVHSLAILPIQNLSGDPAQDYLADGMTGQLIADMGQIAALRVISRTSSMSYKGTRKTLPEIARELEVDAIVEGSMSHEGKRVRITANLVDARTDSHLWSHTYDRDLTSALALQGEVAQSIADEIKVEVSPQVQARLARANPVNLEAQELYLRGIYVLNAGDPQRSLAYFQSAIDKYPNYAEAHSATATAYGELGNAGWLPYSEAFTRQRNEALKAIEMDGALAEGHVDLANALLSLDWDWVGAEKEFTRAIELSPNSAFAHRAYSHLLCRAGKQSQALAEAVLYAKIDPASRRSLADAATIHYFGRQYDQALAILETLRSSDPNPTGFGLNFSFGVIYVEKGMYDRAIREFEMMGDRPHGLGHLGNAYARAHRQAEARETIPKLLGHVAKEGLGRYEIALVYAGLGEKNQAIAWLEKAYNAHDKGMTYLKIDPCLDPLRSDIRFQDLLRRMRFPS